VLVVHAARSDDVAGGDRKRLLAVRHVVLPDGQLGIT
jgi:hypothetical protein